MIQAFVDRFMEVKPAIREKLAAGHPGDYEDLVKLVVENIRDEDDYNTLDPDRIHEINDGSYQGTLVYVIAGSGYSPSDYWYVKVSYGSCSGCDTLQAISGYSDEPPTEQQIEDYMTLALHIVQGLTSMQATSDQLHV